jgi:hypothetical protein
MLKIEHCVLHCCFVAVTLLVGLFVLKKKKKKKKDDVACFSACLRGSWRHDAVHSGTGQLDNLLHQDRSAETRSRRNHLDLGGVLAGSSLERNHLQPQSHERLGLCQRHLSWSRHDSRNPRSVLHAQSLCQRVGAHQGGSGQLASHRAQPCARTHRIH